MHLPYTYWNVSSPVPKNCYHSTEIAIMGTTLARDCEISKDGGFLL